MMFDVMVYSYIVDIKVIIVIMVFCFVCKCKKSLVKIAHDGLEKDRVRRNSEQKRSKLPAERVSRTVTMPTALASGWTNPNPTTRAPTHSFFN